MLNTLEARYVKSLASRPMSTPTILSLEENKDAEGTYTYPQDGLACLLFSKVSQIPAYSRVTSVYQSSSMDIYVNNALREQAEA